MILAAAVSIPLWMVLVAGSFLIPVVVRWLEGPAHGGYLDFTGIVAFCVAVAIGLLWIGYGIGRMF